MTTRTTAAAAAFWDSCCFHPTTLMIRILPLCAVCLVGMIACNALAVGSFLQGMEEAGSVKGTALTTAANCLVSAILGIVVWQDNPHLWTTSSDDGSRDDNPTGSSHWSPQQQQLFGLGLVLLGILVLVLPSSSSRRAKRD
eukprot:CAMPEP_0168724630 /NCGR_PEP_ID=MMETSP0724-20121128/3735_1 /TAXON_ID=265536 /ORGANISM="Amphiprora sp., Strain CCMP467" /LENGTH=140 /DNA_ID=CAMNT_0008771385 /DNA_START=164 /DNA_END=586 /DNA_ORIENTATION=-